MRKDYELWKLAMQFRQNKRELVNLPLDAEEREAAEEEVTRYFVEKVAEVLNVPAIDDGSKAEELVEL